VKYSDVQLLEAYGYILALQYQLVQQTQAFEFTPAQKEAIVRGIGFALNGKELNYDPQQVQAQLKEFMGKRQDTYLDKVRTAFTAATTEYFTKLKENKAVIELPSGLRYEIIKPATGPTAKPGQVVVGNFTGALVNGQVIAGNDPQRGPAKLHLEPKLVPGLLEGLQKTGVGGKIRLHIPPNLAYGDEGTEGVPPGATLIFDFEVTGIEEAPKDAAK
jgi:FKBP-type peptidyl-prolyl cis-trans isomerase